MKYLIFCLGLVLLACNTSSTEKEREADSARVDGTRLTDALPMSDSVPPNVQNSQPD